MLLIDSNIKSKKGAITVFLAVIFMSVLLFAGVIIDIARISAASAKFQGALNTSARSVLAGYDRELAGDYGVFAVNTGTGKINDELYRYLRVNLGEYHEGIKFVDIALERSDIEVKGMDNILDEKAFKNQVMEYMKYRAPINATESIIEQFKNLKPDKKSAFAKSEKETRAKAKELRTKVNELNTKIAGVGQVLSNLSAEKLQNLKNELESALSISGSIYSGGGKGILEEYLSSKELTNAAARDGECVENQSQEFDSIMEDNTDSRSVLEVYLMKVNRTIEEVKPMMKDLEALRKEIKELERKIRRLKEGKNSGSDEDIEELREQLEELKEQAEDLEAKIDEELEKLKANLSSYNLKGLLLKDESIQPPGDESQKFVEFIKSKKAEITNKLVKRIEDKWLIQGKEFDAAGLLSGEDFDVMDENDAPEADMGEEEAEKRNDAVLNSLDKLIDILSDAANSTLEKMYTVEYILDKYTFLTSKTSRSHYFSKGEIEYIIAGADTGDLYNSLSNTEYYVVEKVLLEVWALRFAVDAIDDFARSTVVFPPQRLAFALIEGALDASIDMYNMLNGEPIPITPKSFTSIKLKYSDHLRLLLFMKPEEELLRKARQLMQVNIKQVIDGETGKSREDFELGRYSTVISVKAEVKVNLLFLPLLKVDKLMPGYFEEGRYVIRKQIYVGY